MKLECFEKSSKESDVVSPFLLRTFKRSKGTLDVGSISPE